MMQLLVIFSIFHPLSHIFKFAIQNVYHYKEVWHMNSFTTQNIFLSLLCNALAFSPLQFQTCHWKCTRSSPTSTGMVHDIFCNKNIYLFDTCATRWHFSISPPSIFKTCHLKNAHVQLCLQAVYKISGHPGILTPKIAGGLDAQISQPGNPPDCHVLHLSVHRYMARMPTYFGGLFNLHAVYR